MRLQLTLTDSDPIAVTDAISGVTIEAGGVFTRSVQSIGTDIVQLQTGGPGVLLVRALQGLATLYSDDAQAHPLAALDADEQPVAILPGMDEVWGISDSTALLHIVRFASAGATAPAGTSGGNLEGSGPPDEDLGVPGDVYVDIDALPGGGLYWKTNDGWHP